MQVKSREAFLAVIVTPLVVVVLYFVFLNLVVYGGLGSTESILGSFKTSIILYYPIGVFGVCIGMLAFRNKTNRKGYIYLKFVLLASISVLVVHTLFSTAGAIEVIGNFIFCIFAFSVAYPVFVKLSGFKQEGA